MKTRSSLKSAKLRGRDTTYLVRRGKRVYICSKINPRYKVRQA